MDQLLAALVFVAHHNERRPKRDARSEQAFYDSFDGPPSGIAQLFRRISGMVRQPVIDNCHNRMTCLDHSNRRAMG